MATKAWFNYSTYMTNKLNQMQQVDPDGNWTSAKLDAAFEKAGFVGDTGAQAHFLKYGHKEDVSPNQYFDAKYYYESKAIKYYTEQVAESQRMTKDEVLKDLDTYAKNMEGAIKAAHMDAWTHYIKYGTAEGVNPSNSFDTSDYMQAKISAMGGSMSANEVYAAFKKAGLNALEHFMQYAGKGTNEVASSDISDFEVPDSEKIDGGNAGDTFTLTTGTDTFTGTAKDDTFVAGEVNGQKTLTAGDDLDGGAGTDTLKVSTSGGDNYSGFTMSNIEVLDATADGGAQVFDLSGADGLTTLRSTNSNSAVTFNHVTSVANVEAARLTANNNVAPNITVQYENDAVSGTSDAVSLTLNSSNVGTVKLGSVSDDNGGIESLALQATGGNSTVTAINSDIATLTFTGDKNVAVNTALNTTVKTIDASAATGGLSVAVTGNDVTFTGGAGNDQIGFGDSLNASDTVTGGEGTDRLIAEKAGLIAASAKVSGVEIIRVADQLTGAETATSSTNTLNAGAYADATTFELAQGYNAARINNLTASQNRVDVLSDVAAGNGGQLTLAATATEFTLGLGTTGTENALATDVVFEGNKVATLNVVSNGNGKDDSSAGNTLTVASTALTTVNITGAEDLALTTAGNTVTTIAGGEATGDIDLTGAGLSTSGAKITTGSGNDTIVGTTGKDTIVAGAGADTVTGSQGADTITLGEGADTIVYTSLNQSNSANMDTITDFVNGTDTINVTKLFASKYVGTKDSFDLAQGALVGNGTVSAVFDSSTGRFWVDMDGNGTLDNNDFRVTLSNVSTLSDASVRVGAGAITVVKGQTMTGTDDDDLFVATADALSVNTTKIDGKLGTDTVNVTDQVQTADGVTKAGAAATFTNIEVLNLQGGVKAGVELTAPTNVPTINAGAATQIKLAALDGQTFNGSAQADTVTLGAPNLTVNAGGGNDTVTTSAANLAGSTLNGGAGTDTLTLEDAANIATTGTISGFEVLNIAAAGDTTMTAAQYSTFTGGVVGAGNVVFTTGGAADAGTGTTAVNYTFANASTNLDLTGITAATGNFVIQGGTKADTVTVKASDWTKTSTFDNTTADANDTLLINVDAAFNRGAGELIAKVGEVDFSGSVAGLNVTFNEASNAGLSTVDISNYSAGATIVMNDVDTTAQTINAVNGGADTITISTKVQDATPTNVVTTVNIDGGDTVNIPNNAAANGSLVANVYGAASGVTNVTINGSVTLGFAINPSSIHFVGSNGQDLDIVSINNNRIGTNNVVTAYDDGNGRIEIDATANGQYGDAGDIVVNLTGLHIGATPDTNGDLTLTA